MRSEREREIARLEEFSLLSHGERNPEKERGERNNVLSSPGLASLFYFFIFWL